MGHTTNKLDEKFEWLLNKSVYEPPPPSFDNLPYFHTTPQYNMPPATNNQQYATSNQHRKIDSVLSSFIV